MKLVAFREKHDMRYFLLKAEEGSEQETQELQRLALHIFNERNLDDWYDLEDLTATQLRYHQKAVLGDTKAALTFLNSRRGWEYEDFEVVVPESF